nr:gephyrin-like molybdotransferase Glp [Pseudoruegeria sp. HB172150]
MPPGVDWTPVDDAKALLRQRLHAVTSVERVPLFQAAGRFLAEDVLAERSNPPMPNSAVDGYGFAAAATGQGVQILPLVPGRAAAGQPFEGEVPDGHAIRILTGAMLPDGVDTVVLQEDVTAETARIAFRGPIKPGSNTRKAGEDVPAATVVFKKSRRLEPQDLALLASVGVREVRVHVPLKIGVLSTGDEIRAVGQEAKPHQIFDANRPMLLSLVASWGYRAVDLGHVQDDRHELSVRMNMASEQADVILTTGGASAGEEDHISALLKDTGTIESWRIAVKPGRPLALGLWRQVPVFGLPGNPVAAYVCTLVFGGPAFRVLAGGDWQEALGYMVPAAFSKSKKPGRREYLRARLNGDGAAEVFRSEGSGRISGLSWASGLVEIGDAAQEIRPGDPVRFLPFEAFGR